MLQARKALKCYIYIFSDFLLKKNSGARTERNILFGFITDMSSVNYETKNMIFSDLSVYSL